MRKRDSNSAKSDKKDEKDKLKETTETNDKKDKDIGKKDTEEKIDEPSGFWSTLSLFWYFVICYWIGTQ